jgi:hypothetical protein
MDQVGRKSETTLGIARLHFEISTVAGAASDPVQAATGRVRRREQATGSKGRTLTRDRRRRLTEIGRDGDADGPGVFHGKLEPAGRGHGEPRNLGDNGAESAMAQSFFKAGEDEFLV